MKIPLIAMLLLGCTAAFAADTADKKPAQPARARSEKMLPAKPAAAPKAGKARATTRKPGRDEIGKEAVCPVTGDKVKISPETISVTYKGRIYYFCCNECDTLFKADPEKYAVKEKPKQSSPKARLYICPMGDYQGDKPGKCPKCGMNLQEKK
ncbi:MAG: YHS domain-containing protein [Elusimicrobia bacterium]|nr:YHS domain-containing protein [Elusimicrobiota bacterium]